MKKISLVLAMIWSMVVYGQNAQIIDWQKAPKNPIVIHCTSNHDGLFGNVKKVTETASNSPKSIKYWQYNENGFYQSGIDSSDFQMKEYIARYKEKIIGVTTKIFYKNKLSEEIDEMGIKNSNGVMDNLQITSKIIGGRSSVTQDYFSFGKKGEIQKKWNNMQQVEYKYNKKGQIIEEKSIYNQEPEYTITYDYVTEGNFLTVISTTKYVSGSSNVSINKYNQTGSLIESSYIRDGFEEKTTYVLDEKGNWVQKTCKDKQIATGKIVNEYTVNRKITYY